MYNGQISAVIHAVDIRSGTTVALKLYKRSKLTDVERRQVSTHMGGVGGRGAAGQGLQTHFVWEAT